MTRHDQWLSLVTEKVLEPEIPICDAHHHIWNFESDGKMGGLMVGQRYLAADYVKDVGGGHNIKQSVVVQSRGNNENRPGGGMTPIQETLFVVKQDEELKSKINVAAGIVGFVDLTAGKAAAADIEAQLEAGKKRFKGIRNDLKMASDPKFLEGFALLSKYNLSFDLLGDISQFPQLVEIAKKFPSTALIIEHMGFPKMQGKTPQEKDEILAEWRRRIQMTAVYDNIYMKLGGSAMPDRGFGFSTKPEPPSSEEMVRSINSHYQFLIEQFGPKRCMFESNIPSDKASASYTVIWNAFKLMTRSFTETERAYLFTDTASQVYNLKI